MALNVPGETLFDARDLEISDVYPLRPNLDYLGNIGFEEIKLTVLSAPELVNTKSYHPVNDIFSLACVTYNTYNMPSNYKLLSNSNSTYAYRNNVQRLFSANYLSLPTSLQGRSTECEL